MEWSTPSRVARGKALQPLPQELYLEIFEYVDHSSYWQQADRKRTLKSLALVCRYFHSVAVPRIFRTLHFMGAESLDDILTATSTIFCASILKKLEPASSFVCHIQECSINPPGLYDGLGEDIENSLMRLYKNVLGELHNLRSLDLRHLSIDRWFLLEGICNLHALKSLSFRFVQFVELEDKEFFKFERPPLAIKDLRLTHLDFAAEFPEKIADVMTNIVDLARLESLTLDEWAVAEGIFLAMETSALVKLVVHDCTSPNILMEFIGISKSLEILELRDVSAFELGLSPQKLPKLPKLRRLACPEFMLYLVTGHPISSIEITGSMLDSAVTNSLSLMKSSSAIPQPQAVHELTSRHPQAPHSLVSFGFVFGDVIFWKAKIDHEQLLHQLTSAFPNPLAVLFPTNRLWVRPTIKDSWIEKPDHANWKRR